MLRENLQTYIFHSRCFRINTNVNYYTRFNLNIPTIIHVKNKTIFDTKADIYNRQTENFVICKLTQQKKTKKSSLANTDKFCLFTAISVQIAKLTILATQPSDSRKQSHNINADYGSALLKLAVTSNWLRNI